MGILATSTVYKAWEPARGRTVALKVLNTNDDPMFARIFDIEATTLKELRHGTVPEFYDSGDSNGWKFIAMEFVEGASLHKLLSDRHRIVPETATSIAISVANTLAFVHAQGYIRNDLKPSNICVDVHGKVYVTDFGTSRKAAVAGFTQLMGTPLYMAPEQFRNKDLGPASEVYALGLILYEMVCGTRPFGSENIDVLIQDRANGVFPPTSRFGVPRELGEVIERCLAGAPDQRYAGMHELEEALLDTVRCSRPPDVKASFPELVNQSNTSDEAISAHTVYLDGAKPAAGRDVSNEEYFTPIQQTPNRTLLYRLQGRILRSPRTSP